MSDAEVAELQSRIASISGIVRRTLACGQLEKLEDAKKYLSEERQGEPKAKPDHHYVGPDR